MAILRRYAAMFRVGTSFIFSRIKSRSASVTLNLICTVLLRPSMLSLLSIPRVWDTSQQAIFYRRAATREGENTEVGTRFLCLLRNFLPLSLLHGKSDFAKAGQKKNAANCDVSNCFFYEETRELYSPVVSLLASSIPFAVADRIFKSFSLMPSSMVSS